MLLILRTLYVLRQASVQFWKELLKSFRFMKYTGKPQQDYVRTSDE